MVVFTSHALRKMKQRQLRKTWVKDTINKAEYIVPSYSNRKIAYKKIVKLYLAVVFVKEIYTTTILTAHWEKKFKPQKEEN